MRDDAPSPYFLLGSFADFYEEVANIKLEQSKKQLGVYLAVQGETAPAGDAELARRASARLEAILRRQASEVRRRCSVPEIRMHALAQYVMASMADEIFILEVDWPGSETWMECLLEHKLFRSCDSGRRFFDYADRLLHTPERSILHADLASVFLLALQLGFKGLYRDEPGEATLRAYRHRLYRFAHARSRDERDLPAFPQAYQHRTSGDKDERLAPLSRWYTAGTIAAAAWLAVSTIVWVVSLYPFEQAFGG